MSKMIVIGKKEKKRAIKMGRFSVSLTTLLMLALVVSTGTVLAVAYVVLNYTSTATVVPNPYVCFIKWADGTKANSFDYSVNIFPSVQTVDENITYGLENWDTVLHTCYLSWVSLTTTANIASFNMTVYNVTNTIYSQQWDVMPSFPTAYVSLTPANGNYTIMLKYTATAPATGSSDFAFDLKVDNP